EISLRQHVKQLVRAVAADDLRRVEPVRCAERLAERRVAAIGIAVETRRRLAIGRNRQRGGPERRFVRRQFNDRAGTAKLRPPWNVGVDREHARPGAWSLSAQPFVSMERGLKQRAAVIDPTWRAGQYARSTCSFVVKQARERVKKSGLRCKLCCHGRA